MPKRLHTFLSSEHDSDHKRFALFDCHSSQKLVLVGQIDSPFPAGLFGKIVKDEKERKTNFLTVIVLSKRKYVPAFHQNQTKI